MTNKAMTPEEATAYVIRELGKHRKRNDILMTLCEQAGMSWPQAEKFVQQVESGNQRAIVGQQSILLMVISVVLVISGLGGLMYGLQYVAGFFQRDAMGQLLSLRTGYFAIGALFTGAGMFGGGLYGLIRTISRLFREE